MLSYLASIEEAIIVLKNIKQKEQVTMIVPIKAKVKPLLKCSASKPASRGNVILDREPAAANQPFHADIYLIVGLKGKNYEFEIVGSDMQM